MKKYLHLLNMLAILQQSEFTLDVLCLMCCHIFFDSQRRSYRLKHRYRHHCSYTDIQTVRSSPYCIKPDQRRFQVQTPFVEVFGQQMASKERHKFIRKLRKSIRLCKEQSGTEQRLIRLGTHSSGKQTVQFQRSIRSPE